MEGSCAWLQGKRRNMSVKIAFMTFHCYVVINTLKRAADLIVIQYIQLQEVRFALNHITQQ